MKSSTKVWLWETFSHIFRPNADTHAIPEELRGGGIVQWTGLLHRAGVLQGPGRRGQQTGIGPKREPQTKKAWKTLVKLKPQSRVGPSGFAPLSVVLISPVTISSPHAMYRFTLFIDSRQLHPVLWWSAHLLKKQASNRRLVCTSDVL